MKRSRSTLILVFILLLLLTSVPLLIVRADFGTNWSATFFNNPNLQGSGVAVGGINGINFNWGSGPAVVNGTTVPITNCVESGGLGNTSANCQDFFSARFTSTQALTPGTYQFVVSSDDGVRVYINGALRLDKFIGRPLTTDTFIENITTNPVSITVEYFEGIDQAVIQVQWFLQGANTTPGAGGTAVVTTPVITSVPLTASVVSVKGLSVRSGPYLGASLVAVARPGTAYGVSARNRDESSQFTWYFISMPDGKTGWASGRYLEFTTSPDGLPIRDTIFQQIDGTADTGAIAVPRSIMNLRRRPSIRSELLAQIPWGAELPLLGRTIQAGKDFWYHVRYNGQVGWIYAPYVGVRGDLNAVPIR